MARRNAGNHSDNEESDPGAIGIQAQHQLVQVGFNKIPSSPSFWLIDHPFLSSRKNEMTACLRSCKRQPPRWQTCALALLHFNKTDALQSRCPFPQFLISQLKPGPSRLEVVASTITRVIEAIERRREIERQMETLVNQVAFSTQVVEGMMKAGFKGREDNAKETRY